MVNSQRSKYRFNSRLILYLILLKSYPSDNFSPSYACLDITLIETQEFDAYFSPVQTSEISPRAFNIIQCRHNCLIVEFVMSNGVDSWIRIHGTASNNENILDVSDWSQTAHFQTSS